MRLGILVVGLVLACSADDSGETAGFKSANVEYEHFFNHGHPSKNKASKEKLENEVLKSKVEVLGEVLKHRVQALRNVPGQKVELVFLVDSSASVGAENFFNELKFVKKLLADFTVSSDAARVAVVTFSSKNRVVRHIDHLSSSPVWQDDDQERHKCRLLEQELPAIGYTGGGTYTLGAILEAQSVLEEARSDAVKAVFLITDGYSNGGDPRPAAKRLREQGVRIFTFGIRNGNVKELFDMASEPAQEHSYIVDSFEEFEALARRALHEDLQTGSYLPQRNRSSCDRLCKEQSDCCHASAECTCGTHTGHYACLCPPGHYGTGIKDDCHPCPGGTYRSEGGPGDVRSCRPCPDENHISPPGSTSADQCQCPRGYVPSDGGRTCQLLACPRLEPPVNGYFVKQTCNSVFNGACGIRCNGGYRLVGSSIRLCQENGTWSGEEATCQMRSCGPLAAPKNGNAQCTSDDYVIDSECTFNCDPGYTLVGSRTRVCLPIGYWDGLPAFCKPVFCNPLPKLMNGTLSPIKCPQAKMRYGEQCNATCAPGFELRGPAVRRCSDQGAWTDEDVKTRCVDVTPPEMTCPPDAVLEAEEGENFASFSWDVPLATDNSGSVPDVSSVPAITEQPMRFRIGVSTVTYRAQDRRGNQAECSFQVSVADSQPPTVDQCESPPTFLLHDRDTNVTWDEPIFSDNSGRDLIVTRSHDPGPFPLGETQVVYSAFDESGNNSTCTITIRVQEHACHLPVDPIHGQANCSQQPDAVYCSLTCHDGYAFAMPPPRSYFCAYDGQWLPADNPLPFPDCSVTTHSDALIQDGLVVLSPGEESNEDKLCQDPFLMSQMEGHFKRRLAARLNEICGDNMICQIDDLQAECRQVIAEDPGEDPEWEQSNEIPRSKRHLDEKSEKRARVKNSLELRFRVFSRLSNKTNDGGEITYNLDQEAVLQELNQIRVMLMEAVKSGEFNILTADRMLNVIDVKIGGDDERPGFSCPMGSVPLQGDESNWAKCVMCPIGTFFNVVNEVCESCSQGSYQPDEGKLSCLVCPNNTSTKVVNAKHAEDCQAQCLAGSYSPTGLEPCSTCPQGTYQSEYSQRHCQPCPEGMTTWRRGARRIEDCKSVCPKGYVSETGLAPCFSCPMGYYQPLSGQRFCIRCPKRSPFTSSSGAVHRTECLRTRPVEDPFAPTVPTLPEAETTEEFEEASLLEVNECFSLPCLNGGQCQALAFGYVCSCPPGYTGMQCQTDIDDCASTPCLNGATCVDGIDKYECRCPPGFTGSQCQTDVDECLSGPCQNGATCVDRTLGYSCICPPGMAGPHCEMEVDECLSGPCQNGATCYDRMANYSCSCAPGWTGKLCEQAVDECLSQPCQNGATCEDLVGQFACHCPPGYRGIQCQEDINECDPFPCSAGSTCQDRIGSFACLCQPGVVGETCDSIVDPDFSLDFTSAGMLDYAAWESGLRGRDLTEFTLCAWIRTIDQGNYGTVFSYATDSDANSLTLMDYSGFVLYVNGAKVVTDTTANDGKWHLICFSWSSLPVGQWRVYKDGELADSGIGLSANRSISSNGTAILGQEQDLRGGGFSHAESFVGQLFGVELWDYILDESAIASFTLKCHNSNSSSRGNVLTWADFKRGLRGGVRVEESPFCRGCAHPISPQHGSVSVIGNEAIYECNRGYELAEGSSPRRPCLVHGGWSGPEPQCRRVSCNFPGYVLNGLVNGTSYVFGDTVVYSCMRGFRLSGTPVRLCDEGGQWSGEAPECVPVTCDKPLPPANGSFVEPIKETYSEGEQVRFQCATGFRLDGPPVLTCQDEGSWDDVVPVCQPLACTQPPYVEHGIVTNGVAEILPDDLPHFLTPGSILTFACQFGYQLESTDSVQCSHDGFWIGTIPRCIPIRCGMPPSVLHATVHYSRPDDDRVGTVASYECQIGFEPYGPTELECTESGTWLDRNKVASLPVCMLVDCGSVPSVENAEVYAEDQTYGSRATVTCYSGFKRVGPADYIECQADKKWSDPPDCRPIACTEAPSIRNGTHSPDPPFAAGDLIEFNCTEGFKLSGSVGPMECLEDGSWRGDEPQCLPIECQSPESIENGKWNYSVSNDVDDGTIYYTGAEITYTCDNGYRLEGPSKRRCLGPVGWLPKDPAPFCRILPPGTYCPPLDNPVHGSVVVEGFEPSQTATFECDTGFQPNTDVSQLTCGSEGNWEPEVEFKCEEITCQEPSAPVNGSVRFTSTTFGSKVIFQCDQGFTLTGAQQRTCGSEGDWIGGTTPRCQPRKCTVPDIIEHGYIGFEVGGSATSLSTGSVILYDCEEGYKLVGPRERTCLSTGDWAEEEPSCQQIYCEKLPERLAHGTITGSEANVYGSVVQFSCDAGYELDGPETVTCEDDENWSGLLPTCRPIQCPFPGLIPNADAKLSKADTNENSNLYHFGDAMKYLCQTGYAPVPGSIMERRCLADGSWTSNEPLCRQVSCPSAPVPANGYVNSGLPDSAGAVSGQIVEFRCKAGYELSSGPSTATCLEEGNWDVSDPPVCSPVHCPSPAAVKNGKLNANNQTVFVFESKVTYACDEGFKPDGPVESTCNASGVWNSAPPKCTRATCPKIDVKQLKDGFIKPVYPDGEKSQQPYMLKFACRVGYDLVGNATARCKSSGEWSHSVPACVPWPCDSPPVPRHGRILSTDVTDDAVIARVQCDKGHDMAGGNLTCGPSGAWHGKVECRAQQCQTPLIAGHAQPAAQLDSVYRYGDEVVFQCPTGYVENTSALVCDEDGKWTGQLPACQAISCPEVAAPLNGYVTGSSVTVDGVLRFSCDEGFAVDGSDEITCGSGGQWSGEAATCVPVTCANPADIENGWMSVHGNRVGDIVTYSCSSGYRLSGKSERTCSSTGQWSDADPACDPVVCPVPDVPDNGSWHVGGFVPGAAIRFECQPGFTVVGAASITCLADKTWSDRPPTCQQVTCPPLKDPEHGKVVITRWTSDAHVLSNEVDHVIPAGYRSVANYRCDKGYQLFGPDQRICSARGSWTERGPQCQRIWCPEPQPPDQGFVMGTGRQYGDKIRYACSTGHRLVGHAESACQADGTWSVSIPECQALTCNAPPPAVHHAVVPPINRTVVGTQLKIRCVDGHAPVGDLTLNCLPNQQWSEVRGHCKSVKCPRPGVRGAATVAVIGGSGTVPANGVFRFGDRVVITCQNSRQHQRSNSAILVCSADGKWTGQLPNCEASDCDNFCSNGGSCSMTASGTRKCSCPHGYTGDRCQHAYCILPCLNLGTCVAPYRCACRPGFTGKRCETPICEQPCLNGGRCVSPNVCHCPPGTVAPNCRKKNNDFFTRGK